MNWGMMQCKVGAAVAPQMESHILELASHV